MNIKTVTMCGGMKFVQQMKEIAFYLEIEKDFNVLQCVYNEKNRELTKEALDKLAIAHYKKIEMSDAIYVVDIDGYIGNSVKSEIEYAMKNRKEIMYHSQQRGNEYE